ncbi:BsuPI-related putative proteinase inhibitor [Virgibacillus sp. DJP39]|uniref:BsuPI-related putative proteinase inhibitor n=1 Tax=Virgibacillus sp. DJP39 TaxID=3409790 RepID=UPI003BB4B0B4
MKKRGLIQILFCGLIIVLLSGCGSSDQTNSQQGSDKEESVTGEVVPSLIDLGNGMFEYRVKNQTGKVVEFEFTSGQRYDYALINKDGEQVFLYSSVASFIQALGEEKLKPGEELVYEIDLSKVNVKSGTYILEAWLTATRDEKYKVSTDYIVE